MYRCCKFLNFAKWLNFAKYLGSKVPTFLDVRLLGWEKDWDWGMEPWSLLGGKPQSPGWENDWDWGRLGGRGRVLLGGGAKSHASSGWKKQSCVWL